MPVSHDFGENVICSRCRVFMSYKTYPDKILYLCPKCENSVLVHINSKDHMITGDEKDG